MNKIQININSIFKKHFGYILLNKRLKYILKEFFELIKWNDVKIFKWEDGNIFMSINIITH